MYGTCGVRLGRLSRTVRMTDILEGAPKMKLIRIDWLIQTEIVERRKSEEAAED